MSDNDIKTECFEVFTVDSEYLSIFTGDYEYGCTIKISEWENLKAAVDTLIAKEKPDDLPIVDGYTTSIRKESGNILFSSVTDGWCFECSVDCVNKLLANGELKKHLSRQHNKCVDNRKKHI